MRKQRRACYCWPELDEFLRGASGDAGCAGVDVQVQQERTEVVVFVAGVRGLGSRIRELQAVLRRRFVFPSTVELFAVWGAGVAGP